MRKKLFQYCSLIAGFLFCAGALALPSFDSHFPKDKVLKGKVMILVASPEVERITTKLQAAVAKDPEWFKSHAAKAAPGKPLAFDKRMGVTQAEYNQLLTNKLALRESAKVDVTFKRSDANQIKISAKGTPIDGLLVSSDKVVTPYGTLTTKKAINNTDQTSPTGAWEGIQWKLEKVDEGVAKSIQFNVGKLKKSGEGIIYYDGKDIEPSANRNTQFTYILIYPLL